MAGDRFQDVAYEPDPERAGTWRYRTGRPRPERAPDGGLTAHVFELGATMVVQLGVRLGLEPDEERELAAAIQRDRRLPSPPSLITDWQPVEHVTLALSSAEDTCVLAQSVSSGIAPFVAVLHARVDGHTADAVRNALEARQGLVVTYTFASTATAATDVTSWFAYHAQ